MPVVNGYCTVEELRAWMGDTGTILQSDVLEESINSASRGIENYCGIGRKFWLDDTAIARDFRVREPDIAWVYDIGTLTGLKVETDDVGDGSFSTTWSSADYDVSPFEEDTDRDHAWYRIHAIGRTFPVNRYRRTLRVTARWGWSSVPSQVHQACLMKANILALRKNAPYGVVGTSEYGVIRVNRGEDPEVVRLLAPFVRSNVVVL